MKGAAQRWLTAAFVGSSVWLMVFPASAQEAVGVTDADRVFRNFTRETSTVAPGQLRVEVRGLSLQEEGDAQTNIAGLKVSGVGDLTGGVIDLLVAYGFMENAEAGFILPGMIEKRDPRDSVVEALNDRYPNDPAQRDALLQALTDASPTEEGFGDLLFYTKFQYPLAEHTSVGGGAEFTLPSGSESKLFGTGEFGANPFVSARYQNGAIGVGGHVGYQLYTGDARDVFNYSAHGIVRPSATYALRVEWSGRVFHQGGVRYHDSVLMPGIDFNLSEAITIRPVGLAGVTGPSLDYGIGLGLATTEPEALLGWIEKAEDPGRRGLYFAPGYVYTFNGPSGDSKTGFDARVGYRLHENFAAELNWQRYVLGECWDKRSGDCRTFYDDPADVPEYNGEPDVDLLMSNVKAYPFVAAIQPYAILGVGGILGRELDDDAVLRYGAGVDIYLGTNMVLAVEGTVVSVIDQIDEFDEGMIPLVISLQARL